MSLSKEALKPAEPDATPATTNGLKRELKLTDAAAFSIGLIGPVGGMALLGVGAAELLGKNAVMAFVFAVVGVGLVAYGFVKLSGYISNVGSVFGLVGKTIGPRAGFVAGWAIVAAYVTIATGSTIEIGLFFNRFLSLLGFASGSEWIWVAIIALAIITALSVREIKLITKILLWIEIAGAVLVAILSIVILVRDGVGAGPTGQTLSWSIFGLPAGSSFTAIAGAAVFGFLAFAGFEGAAALGEETTNPKKQIPRAITVAVILVAVFFLLVVAGQTIGYGLTASGVKSFQSAQSPYADLGVAYIGTWYAAILNLMASISLVAITIGTLAGAARVMFALGRDVTSKPNALTRVNKRGVPIVAQTVAAIVVLLAMIIQRLIGTDEKDATFYWLTIGTIALLVAYALATAGALKFLFLTGKAKAPRWQIVIPILGLAFVLYTIYSNVVGVAAPYSWFPYVVLGWVVLGYLIVAIVPGATARVRQSLADKPGDAEPTPLTANAPSKETK